MSSDPNIVILYSVSDSDVEGSMSSTAVSPIIPPVPELPLLASGEDTEPFEEEETAPTPNVSPIAPLDVTCTPTNIYHLPLLLFPQNQNLCSLVARQP